jgi:hypothetical protein
MTRGFATPQRLVASFPAKAIIANVQRDSSSETPLFQGVGNKTFVSEVPKPLLSRESTSAHPLRMLFTLYSGAFPSSSDAPIMQPPNQLSYSIMSFLFNFKRCCAAAPVLVPKRAETSFAPKSLKMHTHNNEAMPSLSVYAVNTVPRQKSESIGIYPATHFFFPHHPNYYCTFKTSRFSFKIC